MAAKTTGLIRTVSGDDATTTVFLSGELAVNAAEALDHGLDAVAAGRPKRVIFDLGDVTRATTVALGALVAFYRRVKQMGGRCVLRNVQPAVMEWVRRTRLHELFEVTAAPAVPLA